MDNENKLNFYKTELLSNDFKSQTCCFTGYRPQKVNWEFNSSSKEYLRVAESIENLINQAIKNGYKYFISGMALGFDTLCAETVLKLKTINPEIKLICDLPCKEQDKYWSHRQKRRRCRAAQKIVATGSDERDRHVETVVLIGNVVDLHRAFDVVAFQVHRRFDVNAKHAVCIRKHAFYLKCAGHFFIRRFHV